MMRYLLVLVGLGLVLTLPQFTLAQDKVSYRCEISPNAGRNAKKTPRWIAFDADFYTGKAVVTMPGIGGKGEIVEEGRIGRETDALFSIKWRALVELGYYTKTSVLDHRLTSDKAKGSGRYRSGNVRGRGNLSGAVRCHRQ